MAVEASLPFAYCNFKQFRTHARRCSTNFSARGVSTRFFSVAITTGQGSAGISTLSILSEKRSAFDRSTEFGSIVT